MRTATDVTASPSRYGQPRSSGSEPALAESAGVGCCPSRLLPIARAARRAVADAGAISCAAAETRRRYSFVCLLGSGPVPLLSIVTTGRFLRCCFFPLSFVPSPKRGAIQRGWSYFDWPLSATRARFQRPSPLIARHSSRGDVSL